MEVEGISRPWWWPAKTPGKAAVNGIWTAGATALATLTTDYWHARTLSVAVFGVATIWNFAASIAMKRTLAWEKKEY